MPDTRRTQLGPTASLIETLYIQPQFDDASAYRVLGEITLLTKLSARTALTNGFTVSYDATPPVGVKRYDTALKVGAVVAF